MIEAWLPTAISLSALGLVFFFIRNSLSSIRNEVMGKMQEAKLAAGVLEKRVAVDEDKYLSIKEHDLTCMGRQNEVKLHINEVMRMMREELKREFGDIWKKMDEIQKEIRNGKK
jgi:hypothetical protein